eukprot:scaffold111591_cov24-Phaeocystis_antarctica.AAC.1
MACVFESAAFAAAPWRAATAATIASADRVRCLSPRIALAASGGAPVTGSGSVRLYYAEGQ